MVFKFLVSFYNVVYQNHYEITLVSSIKRFFREFQLSIEGSTAISCSAVLAQQARGRTCLHKRCLVAPVEDRSFRRSRRFPLEFLVLMPDRLAEHQKKIVKPSPFRSTHCVPQLNTPCLSTSVRNFAPDEAPVILFVFAPIPPPSLSKNKSSLGHDCLQFPARQWDFIRSYRLRIHLHSLLFIY